MNKQTQAEKRMNNNDLSLTARLSLLSEAAPALARATAPRLPELVQRQALHTPHALALVRHFIDIRHPQREFEQEVWVVVHDYLRGLDSAYATSVQALKSPQPAAVVHGALLQRLENLALLALWHCLRYQPPPESYWRALHAAYLMAESVEAVALEAAARYLQVLVLDSVDHGNLSRREIALVNDWLSQWCRKLELARTDDGSAHQFVVEVQAPHGARYLRQHDMAADGRYWRMDDIVAKLQAMRDLIGHSRLPPEFPRSTPLPNALRLVNKLLLAWAPEVAQRERRKEERRSVVKPAQVVHGIFNVCQHLKNTGFVAAYQRAEPDDSVMAQSGWQISNESGLGYGALVQADTNRWLEPGCLIAMNDDLNRGLTAIGIVRSIEQRTPQQYFAGVEVLSHMPSYVRLQRLTTDNPIAEASLPFPAIFLPAGDEPAQPSTLVLPLADYETGAVYEMRTPQLAHLAQTGEVIEQQADWVRVAVEVAADITL